jgi:hypothetical protein
VLISVINEELERPMNAATETYAIATYCGQKFGGWLVGTDRYASQDQAIRAAEHHTGCEAQAKATRMVRMVLAVSQ